MRGESPQQTILFSYRSVEDRIPAEHPLRVIRQLVEPVLRDLSPRLEALYAKVGRPSIPPEHLLRALLLQVLFTIRSERRLMEELDYNLLYRWFVGLNPDEPVWVPTVFSKNRERLLEGDIAQAFFDAVQRQAAIRQLLSHEHFTVDGTLLEAWASQKSVRPIAEGKTHGPSDDDPKNPTVNFRGERRSNATHRSLSDPDARLAKKSKHTAAILCYLGSVMTDNRHGLVVATDVREPGGHAEEEAALEMLTILESQRRHRTLGADKGYDSEPFVTGARSAGVTPHVSQNIHTRRPRSAIDERTTRHPGYAISQCKRKLVEQGFGWGKTVGLLRKLRHRRREKVSWIFAFTNAAYNLVRIRTLIRAGICA